MFDYKETMLNRREMKEIEKYLIDNGYKKKHEKSVASVNVFDKIYDIFFPNIVFIKGDRRIKFGSLFSQKFTYSMFYQWNRNDCSPYIVKTDFEKASFDDIKRFVNYTDDELDKLVDNSIKRGKMIDKYINNNNGNSNNDYIRVYDR